MFEHEDLQPDWNAPPAPAPSPGIFSSIGAFVGEFFDGRRRQREQAANELRDNSTLIHKDTMV